MSSPLLLADCKRAVSTLTNLNNEELDSIMNDDDKIQNILLGLDQTYLKEIEQEKEKILANNRAVAEENLSREPELVLGREQLQTLTEQGEDYSKRVEEKARALRSKNGDLSLETTLALLQTAASEMEEESEKYAKQFLDSELDLEDFLEQFQHKRRIMHLRLVKAEKMAKILQRDASGGSNYINAPPMNLNTNYFPGIAGQNVPYPTGNMAMPMPGMNFFHNHY